MTRGASLLVLLTNRFSVIIGAVANAPKSRSNNGNPPETPKTDGGIGLFTRPTPDGGEGEMAALVLLAATAAAAASAGGAPDTWMTLRNHQHFEALSEHIGENSVLVSGFFTHEGATALALFKEAHDAQGSILADVRMAPHRPWIFTRSFNRVLSAELCEEAAESQVAGEDFDNCLLLQKSSADGSGGWVAARMNARDLDDVRSFLIEHAGHEVPNHGEL